MDQYIIDSVTREIRSYIRCNIGKRASEQEIRYHFEDVIDQWIVEGEVTKEEAEAALENAIDDHNEAIERQALRDYWRA